MDESGREHDSWVKGVHGGRQSTALRLLVKLSTFIQILEHADLQHFYERGPVKVASARFGQHMVRRLRLPQAMLLKPYAQNRMFTNLVSQTLCSQTLCSQSIWSQTLCSPLAMLMWRQLLADVSADVVTGAFGGVI